MNVCFIPAKGASRRLPGKNHRVVDGLPLWAHAASKAQATGLFDMIYVSTDQPKLFGAYAGWTLLKRKGEQLDPELSATAVTVMHVRDLELADDVCVAQMLPTCPFVRWQSVKAAWDYWRARDPDASLVSVHKLKHVRALNANGWVRKGELHPYDLHGLVRSTGGFQFAQVSTLLPFEGFWTGKTLPWELDSYEGFDIDTRQDWDDFQKMRHGV